MNMAVSEEDDFHYEEDEYGYVKPPEVRASHALMSQLPSRHIENLIDHDDGEEEQDGRRSLRMRTSHYNTLKLKNAVAMSSRPNAVDADKIYQILSKDPDAGYDEKVKTLREMSVSLSIKRRVLQKLNADREDRIQSSSNLGSCFRCKLSIGIAVRRFLFEVRSWCYVLAPWHSSIKAIQGRFGSCVSSYFVFLRWLLCLNLCNLLITLCFVVVPQVVHQGVGSQGNETFSPVDFFTGLGWLRNTLLYFGLYSGDVIEPISGLPYNMPLAYLCTVCTNFIIILIVLSISITSSYQKNYVDAAGEIKNVFCNKIFSAWDYSIQTEGAARLQTTTVCHDIKELLFVRRMSERTITLRQRVCQKAVFVAVSFLSLGFIGAIGYVTYILLRKESLKVDTLLQLRFPIIITLINSFSYYLLKYATRLEAFITPKSRLYLTMIRSVIQRAVMMGVVVYFWMVVYKPPRDQNVCYETELGSELYRLMLMNFLSTVFVLTVLFEVARKLVHLYLVPSVSIKEFDVAYNTLDLIYFQTLAWLSMFYAPLVSLIIAIILVVLFYVKKSSLCLGVSCPPDKSWSINEMQTLYLLLTFFMFLFSVLTVGYTIFGLETSDCGPFKEFLAAGDAFHSVFLEGRVGHVFANILKYGTSPVVLVVVFCALCLAVHYMRAKADAHILVIKKIRETLILASKDKVFLLQLYDEAVSSHIKNRKRKSDDEKSNGGVVVVNEAYSDNNSLQSPRKYHPNYAPADVPVNRLPHLSPQQQEGEGHRGSPFPPPHQPGFRHILSPGKRRE